MVGERRDIGREGTEMREEDRQNRERRKEGKRRMSEYINSV